MADASAGEGACATSANNLVGWDHNDALFVCLISKQKTGAVLNSILGDIAAQRKVPQDELLQRLFG